MKTPARLHTIFAKQSSLALIIRRGPSKETAIIGWDRKKDHFTMGQWLKGKIYPYRSDISPDGRHWIYFAMGAYGKTWTAVAKVPYLKALDFYPQNDAWGGGGIFMTNQDYQLNTGISADNRQIRRCSGLTPSAQWQQNDKCGEWAGSYAFRLNRDGWIQSDSTHHKIGYVAKFYKQINAYWQLQKYLYAGSNNATGKGSYYESHKLVHNQIDSEIELPHAEWADIDGKRLVWAEKGKIMSGLVSKKDLQNRTVLFDANPLLFTECKAPY